MPDPNAKPVVTYWGTFDPNPSLVPSPITTDEVVAAMRPIFANPRAAANDPAHGVNQMAATTACANTDHVNGIRSQS